MYCGNCGKQIPDYSVFCPECGQSTGLETVRAQTPVTAAAQPGHNKPKKRRVLWPIFVGAGLLVAAIVVAAIVIGNKNAAYRDAAALFDAGEYAEAQEAYEELGRFSDSRAQADIARRCDAAEALYEKGRYADALEELADIAGYPAVDALRTDCEKGVNYLDAQTLLEQGAYEQAKKVFDSMPDFRDAAELSMQCQYGLEYDQATSLFAQGMYGEAKALFDQLADVSFRDAGDMSALCNNYVLYDEAAAAYQDGKFYTAYEGFVALGDFLDSASMAGSCVQSAPKNGTVYINPSYSNRNVDLTVDNSGSANATYMKLYQGNTLIITIYASAGTSTTVSLPAGTYTFKRAYGSKWFGQEEMFGEDGTYYVLDMGGSSTYTLDGGWSYTLSAGQGGDPVDYNSSSRSGF